MLEEARRKEIEAIKAAMKESAAEKRGAQPKQLKTDVRAEKVVREKNEWET